MLCKVDRRTGSEHINRVRLTRMLPAWLSLFSERELEVEGLRLAIDNGREF